MNSQILKPLISLLWDILFYELVTGWPPYGEVNVLKSNDPDLTKGHIRRQHEIVDLEIEMRCKRLQFLDVTEIGLFRKGRLEFDQ